MTDPHPPGMRVRCSSLEEEFEGAKSYPEVISGKNGMGEKERCELNYQIHEDLVRLYIYNVQCTVQLEFDRENYQRFMLYGCKAFY